MENMIKEFYNKEATQLKSASSEDERMSSTRQHKSNLINNVHSLDIEIESFKHKASTLVWDSRDKLFRSVHTFDSNLE